MTYSYELLIFFILQWENTAPTLYLIQMFILHLPYLILIETTQLIHGIEQPENLISMDMEVS